MTDYNKDEDLRDRCSALIGVESQAAGRYENLRYQVTSVVVLATGGLVAYAFSEEGGADLQRAVPFILIVIAALGFLMVRRLNHAHWFHYMHYLKVRQILVRGHEKLVEKTGKVDRAYKDKTRSFRVIDFEGMWEVVVVCVPLSGALATYLRSV